MRLSDMDMHTAASSNEQLSGPFLSINLRTSHRILCQKGRKNTVQTKVYYCAADFSLLNLPKGKSLGRSKPATSSYA